MKNIYTVFAFIIISSSKLFPVNESGQEYIIDWDNMEHNFFGAFATKYTTICGEPSSMAGIKFAWLINHKFSIGLSGYVQASHNRKSQYIDEYILENPTLRVFHFGLDWEYIIASHKKVHFTTNLHLGGGRLSYEYSDFDIFNYFDIYNSNGMDWFYQIEPSVNVEMNIASWLRLGCGIGYRIATGVDYKFNGEEIKNKDMSGISGILQLKFGSF